NLTETPNKRSLKSHLRENLHAANHDIRSVLYKRLVRNIECNETLFEAQMYTDFANEHLMGVSGTPPPPSFAEEEEIPSFCLNQNGKETVTNILNCINSKFPQVTCCPLLPVAVAMFLHYDEDPAQVFAHACRLIFSTSKAVHYLDINKREVNASALVLKELTQKYSNSSYKSLLSLTSNPDNVYSQWIKCLFHGLPFSYVTVLFDMYLLEGYKALYRLSLSVLKFYRKIGIANATDIVSAVFQFNQKIEQKVSITLLFRKAFAFKLPPSKEIKKRHRKMYLSSAIPESTPKTRKNVWDYMTAVRRIKSEIVNETQLATLYSWLPETITLLNPVILFTTNKHGYNLSSFFSCCDSHEPTIFLIKTVSNEIIGAYLTSSWEERRQSKGYFGTGECFVFSLLPEAKVYKWSGIVGTSCLNRSVTPYPTSHRNDLFMMADEMGIKIGGGGGISISVDTSLLNGLSQRSTTFNNPSLVTTDNGSFVCSMIEVIGFENS
uniref:Oxidation resistance protein 1 n=1 Tax=Ciona savignyi TaxID=51511 RepID=H2YYE8_CIOSA